MTISKDYNFDDDNACLYACFITDVIARIQHLHRDEVAVFLHDEYSLIFRTSDALHCEPKENVANRLIKKYNIPEGTAKDYGKVGPSAIDCAFIFRRLCKADKIKNGTRYYDAIFNVYSSFIVREIERFNSAVYWSPTTWLVDSYFAGKLLL